MKNAGHARINVTKNNQISFFFIKKKKKENKDTLRKPKTSEINPS